MVGALAVVAVLLVILAWMFWPGSDTGSAPRRLGARPDVDEVELERAEREVQEATDADSVRDWGPGAGPPPAV